MSGRPLRNGASTVMARLAAPTTRYPTRLAVISDPHVSTRASGSPKQFDLTESFLEATVTDINSRDVDAVVSTGDLTKDGAPWDFERVDALLAGLSAPFFAVPGNHDVPKTFDDHRSASRGRFVDHYTPGSLPYHRRVGGVDLFGLDSAWTPDGDLRDSHDGRITPGQLGWLESRTAAADCPIVCTHHNLPPTAAALETYGEATGIDMSGVPVMRNGEHVVERLGAAGVPLVLTGHIHLPGVARSRAAEASKTAPSTATSDATSVTDGGTTPTSTFTEITAPATCTFPQAYLLVDIDSRGTTVRYVPITSPTEAIDAYSARIRGTEVDRGQAALGSIRTAQFPLIEEWVPPVASATWSTPSPLSRSSSGNDSCRQ